MKFSIIFAVSLLSAFAQAYSADPYLEARVYDALDDHYRRSDMMSSLTTRELVEELEGRLGRREHEYRDATKAKLHRKVDQILGGGTGGTGTASTTGDTV